jgi:ATP phosphoribosyltransferase regulatory subunit
LVETLAAGPLPLPTGKAADVRELLDSKDAGGLATIGANDYLPLLSACGPIYGALGKLRSLAQLKALDSRLDGIEAIAAAIGDSAVLTLDPTERHGFEFQSWVGFSLFGAGLSGEIGRGGTYTLVHDDGTEEPAVGFSLYLDPLVDIGLGVEPAKRIFLPLDHDPAAAAALRKDGWTTIAALGADDEPIGCGHILGANGPQPITG